MAVRASQKERTRQALLEAARAILRDGRPLTIVAAAEVAKVSTATAYRYFSQPQELILASFVARDATTVLVDLPDEPAARLDELISRFSALILKDESMWREVLVATLEGGPDAGPAVKRTGTRLALTRQTLAPLADILGDNLHRRLAMAVQLVYGIEALVSLRDASDLDPDEAVDVMRWAAQALLRQALHEAAT